ncbi:hypothetical protein chiPu_0026388 [Chiloscyllium punctatum]|uniref:Uncharacterized protein n=1 Tax=Chiloscyllium punctatum TaxID=137246 RepID=A0A401THV6_CHIPU|nr:hypothetical protein [Chiloscyllium punctatum]
MAANRAACKRRMIVPKMTSEAERSVNNKSASDKLTPTIQDVFILQRDASESERQLCSKTGCYCNPVTKLWTTPAGQICMSNELALRVVECIRNATQRLICF